MFEQIYLYKPPFVDPQCLKTYLPMNNQTQLNIPDVNNSPVCQTVIGQLPDSYLAAVYRHKYTLHTRTRFNEREGKTVLLFLVFQIHTQFRSLLYGPPPSHGHSSSHYPSTYHGPSLSAGPSPSPAPVSQTALTASLLLCSNVPPLSSQ